MKLLIITQKVDRTDPILGFFCRWIEEFAKHCEELTVVGQLVKDCDFPHNVTIVSLGKEDGASRLAQIICFWHKQWSLRKQYDVVLVHMTPIWIVLGWSLWLLFRKKMYLWYEIKRGSWRLSVALFFARKIFSATVQGLPRPSRKQNVVGHGIDVETFTPVQEHEEGLIVSVGRITNSKQYPVILKAFAKLPNKYKLLIAGGTITKADEEVQSRLHSLMQKLGISERVEIRWVPPAQMPALFQRANFLLHACVGGLDKVVLEAMACGCPVVTTSTAAREVLPEVCLATEDTMAHHCEQLLTLSSAEREALARDLRSRVEQHHSLPETIQRMVKEMS